MPFSKFNALSPIIQHIIQLGAAFVFVVVAYVTMTRDIEVLQAGALEDKKNAEEMTATVNAIKTEQAVIKENLRGEAEKAREFRERADKTLDRILEKLDKR